MSSDANSPLPSGKVAGYTLVVAWALALFAMLHHPVPHRHDNESILEAVEHVSTANRIVHASALGLLVAVLFGIWLLASRLGLARSWVRVGLLLYAVGTLTLCGAALCALGVSDLASLYRDHAPDDVTAFRQSVHLVGVIQRLLAQLGILGMSLGVVAFSLDLVRREGVLLWIGILGILGGAGSVVAVAVGLLRMNVHGMIVFVLVQLVWGIAMGIMLIRGRV